MPDRTRLNRNWLIAAWAVAAVIVAAYFFLWRYAAGEMEAAVTDWVDDQREAGLVVEYGRIEREGFPFFLRVHIEAPVIEQPGDFGWRAEKLSLDALPYDLSRLIFSPSGAQYFSAGGIGAWAYSAESIRASIAKDKARGWVFSMNIENATATDATGAQAQLTQLVYDLAPAPGTPTTLTLSVMGDAFSLRDAQRSIDIDKLQSAVSLSDTDFLIGADAAARWRDAGGEVNVHGLNAKINGAEVSVFGTLRLDGELRPEGALTSTLEKPAGLADALEASGALDREQADAAIAGLALAAMAQGGRIEAPIELQAGAATIAGVKVADIPPLQ